MSLPVGLVLCLYPYSGLSGLPMKYKVPVWLLETKTGLSGPYRAVEECTVSSPVLLLTGIVLSQNPGIPVSGGIPSHVSRLLTMVAHHLSRLTGNSHLSCLTGNSHLSLARMVVTLRSSRTRGSLPLPRTGGRLTVLPLTLQEKSELETEIRDGH